MYRVDIRTHEWIGRDDLVEHLDFLEFFEELLAAIFIAKVLDQAVDVLVVKAVRDQTEIRRRLLLHFVT